MVPGARRGPTPTGESFWQLVVCCACGRGGECDTDLYCQPMHDLDLPRRYRTIYVFGGLGLGSTREQDEQALRRFYEHLEPGGRLVLDNEVPYSDATHWALWPPSTRDAFAEPAQPAGDRQLGPDGDEYALRSRILGLDPLRQQVAHEIDAYQWRDGSLIAQQRHQLTCDFYFCGELVMMLQPAGFTEVEVRGEYNDLPPTAEDAFLIYVASRE